MPSFGMNVFDLDGFCSHCQDGDLLASEPLFFDVCLCTTKSPGTNDRHLPFQLDQLYCVAPHLLPVVPIGDRPDNSPGGASGLRVKHELEEEACGAWFPEGQPGPPGTLAMPHALADFGDLGAADAWASMDTDLLSLSDESAETSPGGSRPAANGSRQPCFGTGNGFGQNHPF